MLNPDSIVPQSMPETSPAAAIRRNGILIVDDEASVRDMLCVALQQQGFAVWLAGNGRQALEQYQRHHSVIDVVLVDVRMPVLDGPQTLAALQQMNPRVCCRFMSGDTGGHSEWKLSNATGAAVIRKPFHLIEVVQTLWDLAQQVSSIRERNIASTERTLSC